MEIEKLKNRLLEWDGVDTVDNGEFTEVNYHGVFDLLREAADALKQLQAENNRLKEKIQQMRWIPVEEKLPEKENAQVFMTDGESCFISSRNNMMCFLGCEGFFIPGKAANITHWMPHLTHLPVARRMEKRRKFLMNNGEYIRYMTNDELAILLESLRGCPPNYGYSCPYDNENAASYQDCINCWTRWIHLPAKINKKEEK